MSLRKHVIPASLAVLLILLTFSLTACGKKPGFVDPPPNVEEDQFPRTYPDPSTDPK